MNETNESIVKQAIQVEAPSGITYYLLFKHLKGRIKATEEGPIYVCGGIEYTTDQMLDLFRYNVAIPFDKVLLKGHRVATVAYLWRDSTAEYNEYNNPTIVRLGTTAVILSATGISEQRVRRMALSGALSNLPPYDRAFIHLVMSDKEGRILYPIIATALKKRHGTDRDKLIQHLLTIPRYRNIIRTITNAPTPPGYS